MDVQRLRAVQQHILEEPRRVGMGDWFITKDHDPERFAGCRLQPQCNTVACIADWTVALFGDPLQRRFNAQGTSLLGLEGMQADRLFQTIFWPVEFQEKLFLHQRGTQGYAQAVSDYIDWFIKSVVGFEKEML